MSENSGPGGKSNSKKMQDIRETQRETRKIAKPKETPRGGPGAKIQKEGSRSTKKIADTYKEAGPNYKGAGQITWYPAPDPVKPKTGKGGSNNGSDIRDDNSSSVSSAVSSSGLVDDVNLKELYFAEVKKLVMSLINSAKGLLGRYDFSSIDKAPVRYLDSDVQSQTNSVASRFNRPSPPLNATDADRQEMFTKDVNTINNLINDMVADSTKLGYFGVVSGNTFSPGMVRSVNGSATYDMKVTFGALSGESFVVKCYEVL